MRASSNRPPMMLPIKIQSEMGMARPFSTSSTVWSEETSGGRSEVIKTTGSPSAPLSGLTSPRSIPAPRVMRLVSWAVRSKALTILTDLYLACGHVDVGYDQSSRHLKRIWWWTCSLFWKNHHELCGWLGWRPHARVVVLHTQPPCTTTCCSSRHKRRTSVSC